MSYRPNLLKRLHELPDGEGMSQVVPSLYVGSYRDSRDQIQLQNNQISHIVAVHDNAKKLLKSKKYMIILAADSPSQNLLQYISQTNDFIHSARICGGNVLVHCLAGISRSVFLAAAYIMAISPLTAVEALRVVKTGRRIAQPNQGFQRQLEIYESYGLQEERKRLGIRYHNRQRYVEDMDWLSRKLEEYLDLVAQGVLCDGFCASRQTCPSGSCKLQTQNKAFNIFRRRNEDSYSQPSSPRRKQVPTGSISRVHSDSSLAITDREEYLGWTGLKNFNAYQNKKMYGQIKSKKAEGGSKLDTDWRQPKTKCLKWKDEQAQNPKWRKEREPAPPRQDWGRDPGRHDPSWRRERRARDDCWTETRQRDRWRDNDEWGETAEFFDREARKHTRKVLAVPDTTKEPMYIRGPKGSRSLPASPRFSRRMN